MTDGALRFLSIGSHPADVFDVCGGAIALHSARGDYVVGLILTHGARVHDRVIDAISLGDVAPEASELGRMLAERSDVKAAEVRRAGDILGYQEITFLGLDDAVLLATDENVRLVARSIRRIRPHVVRTHYPYAGDGLNAHAVAGQIVMKALSLAGSVDPGDRNPGHRVAQVFFFGTGAAGIRTTVWDSEAGRHNDVFIDITDVIDKKLASLDCLVSQGYDGAYARKRIEASDGAFGVAAGCAYAEGFVSMKAQVHEFLPVTQRSLEAVAESDQRRMARYSYRLPVD